ncbi:cytochrome P450 3A5 [Lasiosphaeris hirsuta]|uniref:Cytochrome P450 3A5 n=1 Tax=Lasiosphaeris hirsuta TaxID=260670 RepID=A0AA40DWD6_9PEZI|nr:cytochrome P450 3A5 [Lasiosphaeris hirsuta]
MDLSRAALVSLAETALWAGMRPEQTFLLRVTELPVLEHVYRFFALFSLQYLLLKWYRIVFYPHFVSPLRHLPGPKDNHPFFGQFIKILLNPSPIGLHLDWHAQWPRAPFIRYLGIGNQETLLINTQEAHKEILQTYCYSFKKPDALYRLVGEISGRGLLFTEGEEHKRQRKFISALFTVPALKRIVPVFQNSIDDMIAYFRRNMDAEGRVTIEAVDCFSNITLDIAGKTVMGINLDNLGAGDPSLNFRASYRRVLQPPLLSALISFVNTFVPVRGWIPLEANLGYVRAAENLRSLVRQCVDQRFADYDKSVKDGTPLTSPGLKGIGRDLMTMMVEETKAAKGSEIVSEAEMVDQILNLLTGGHETTATTLTWAVYVLATRPEIQAALRAEMIPVVAGRQPGDRPDWVLIDRLPYLDGFCKEVLRRYAPVVNSFREPIEDITVCGTFIPKGTLMFFSFSLANLDGNLWGPDVNEFKPERWATLKGTAANPYAMESFSNGPRICVGRAFTYMEIKSILVELLTNFRVLPTPELAALGHKQPPLQNPSITVVPKGGLRVTLEKIKEN